MTSVLDRVRFGPERELLQTLFERYGLEDWLDHFENSGDAAPIYEMVMSTQLRLTPLLAPRMHRLFQDVRKACDFTEPIELFVMASPEINAFALHSLTAENPHVVSMTSGLVRSMTDDEIRFVIGHEIGHLQYRHYRTKLLEGALAGDEPGESRLPPLLQRKLETWDRLAELSADRAGHAAVQGHLDTIVSAFLKMASGLGPEYLSFDLDAYLEQLVDIQRKKRSDFLATFSHPITPVRVRALQLYAEAGGMDASPEVLAEVDVRVAELAQLMEFEATEPLTVAARDLMLSAGLLASIADGEELTNEQHEHLVKTLLPLTADPELEMSRITSVEQAEELLKTCTDWLRQNAGPERYELFELIAHVCAIDGHLHPGEQAFMQRLAGLLEIPEKTSNQIQYAVLAEYLQTRKHMSIPGIHPRKLT